MTSFLSSARCTTRANRCLPRLPLGSRFPSAVCSPELPSWALLAVAKHPAACFLARGADAEVVVQRIADYRSEDKDDPIYYARHTVMKAQAELSRHSGAESSADRDGTQVTEIRP